MLEAARPLLLVGGGRMGAALLAGWRRSGLGADAALAVEPDPARRAALAGHGIGTFPEPAGLPQGLRPGALVLAVKPQAMGDVLPAYRERLAGDTLVVSIAAGKPLAQFEAALGPELGVVRAMPNTPAAVGRGVTVLCANAAASAEQRRLAERLMAAVGLTAWVEDEALMHAVTAVSGSGPAYVFHMVEALTAAGVAAGLPEGLAAELARGTVVGAGELVRQSGRPASELRVDVTSPGGTTAAALEVLMAEAGLTPLLTRAVAAAAGRSRELA
jgi:pyrroline-5-carboxylate reductase